MPPTAFIGMNGGKEELNSHFFHTHSHRMKTAKGLAPHARFGGLLFACDLLKLAVVRLARSMDNDFFIETGLAHGSAFRIIRPSRSL